MRPSRARMDVLPQLENLRRVTMNISFGSGNADPSKNILGWDSGSFTAPGVANTAFTVNHNLGYIPTRFFVTYNNSSGVIYDSGVAWTKTSISLKCSVGSAQIRVHII